MLAAIGFVHRPEHHSEQPPLYQKIYMGLCPKPSVIYEPLTLFTFPHVPYYVPHVLPWFPKRFSGIPYVPIRSVQPLPQIQKRCTQTLRSYTFCADSPAETNKM